MHFSVCTFTTFTWKIYIFLLYCILQLTQVLTSSLSVGCVLLSISICAEYLAVTREHLHADYFNCSGNFLRQATRNCIENTSHKPGIQTYIWSDQLVWPAAAFQIETHEPGILHPTATFSS